MKNVIKKAFSLLLVSVVAVSMFSFITPNRVDAKVQLSNNYVRIVDTLFDENANAKPGYYTIEFFDIDGNPLVGSRRPIEYHGDVPWREEKFYLPLWTAKIEFEAVTAKVRNFRQTKTTFTAMPVIPRSNVGPEKDILCIDIEASGITTEVESYYNYIQSRRADEFCTIFNYISETV